MLDFTGATLNFQIWSPESYPDYIQDVKTTLKLLENDLGHLWHCGEGVIMCPANTDNGWFSFDGYLQYGENIEDEWVAIYLLMKISKEYPDIIIKVWDEDGDFLLAEAADFLPKWANPDTTENRVFIHQAKIHLIPFATKPNEVTPLPRGTPTIMDAVKTVKNYPEITVSSPEIQKAVEERIRNLPEKLNKNLHRCQCFLPANAAALLKSYPTMIAPSVIAFCHRNEDDVKVCKAMKFFPPETRVMISVVMTRHHYAMLTSQKYTPDRRTGWSVLPPTDPKWKAYDLGLKIACGFEILLAHSGKIGESAGKTENAADPKWERYVRNLTEKGYFQGYMEGSKPYKSLQEKAKIFFESSVTENSEEFQTSYKHHMGKQVQSLLKYVDVDYDALKAQETSLQPPDDDSWINVTPDQLDAMFAEKMKVPVNGTEDLAEGLTSFLEKVSSYEGVENVNGRKPPIAPRKKSSSARKSSLQQPSRKVSSLSMASTSSNISALTDKMGFDPDGFAAAMQNILDFGVPDDESFHSNESGDDSSFSEYSSEPEDEFHLPQGLHTC
ncbi:protein ecdysoneless homolog isoform X2 [Artemia franciscana]|uniref:protein ecdysoneless homolog isoform X2 n=1 Tax=Artemia franciscana TaxID=6661 RepID=UPI0032DB139A